MNREQLHALLVQAKARIGHSEFVIVGSLAILGAVSKPPDTTAFFVEPNDVAVSKYMRGDERDLRWLRAGLQGQLIDIGVIERRIASAPALDGGLAEACKRIANHKKRLKLP